VTGARKRAASAAVDTRLRNDQHCSRGSQGRLTNRWGHGPVSQYREPLALNENEHQGTNMSIVSEFKEFAVKGNVMDLAVGVIIGGAFGKIVDSLVNDLIMPLIGKVTGGLDFSNYYIALNGQPAGLPLAEAKKAGAVFAYGNFFTVLLYFIILAFVIFIMIKQVNRLRQATPAAPPPTPEDVLLLRQIRDSLKK
jgi:large conductance mechanosensitive channel